MFIIATPGKLVNSYITCFCRFFTLHTRLVHVFFLPTILVLIFVSFYSYLTCSTWKYEFLIFQLALYIFLIKCLSKKYLLPKIEAGTFFAYGLKGNL